MDLQPLWSNTKVVLLAGGLGERFWPSSTPELPKQFLRLAGDKSLIRATFDRVLPLVPSTSIFVITAARYGALVRRELPELPEDNLILEPEGRDTAAALGLAALWLEVLDPNSVMIALPADHHIQGESKFRATLEAAVEAAGTGALVTLGVHPSRPETGYGYIQVGDVIGKHRGLPLHRVLKFVEKPDLQRADEYLSRGDYLWNSGMFVWQVGALRREIARFLPELNSVLEELGRERTLPRLRKALPTLFNQAPKISIDYGVMEKSEHVCVVPAYFGWDDLGSWTGVERLRPRDEQGNCLNGEVIVHDSRNVIVEGDGRLIAMVGVSDTIVVDTEHALLICHKSRAQDVKKVAQLAVPYKHWGRPHQALVPEGRRVNQPWGQEVWWAETDRYSARTQQVKAGGQVALHCGEGGQETLFIQGGHGQLKLGGEWTSLGPGQVQTLTGPYDGLLFAITDLSVLIVSAPPRTGEGLLAK